MGRPKGSKNKKTIEKELKLAAKKAAKKYPILFLCLVLVVVVAVFAYLYLTKENTNGPEYNTEDGIVYLSKAGFKADELKVTFLELLDDKKEGKIGDSIYIEYGDVDILIDAGDKNEGSNTVVPFIEKHCEDDILELVIITHADADHLGGMVGLSSSVGALEVPGITYQYLIDFDYEGTTKLYSDYVEIRNELVENGTKYYGISSILHPESEEVGSQFYLGVDAALNFLDYQTYADDKIDDDNDRSVVCLITHMDKKFLLCGDAEKKEEAILTDLNIGHVDVFKSNHHGSPTSNTESFLNTITPDYIVISSSEENKYVLPKKVVVERLLKYTDKVYATFINGNIVFISKNNQITTSFEKEDTLIQNSNWYKTNDPDNPVA